MSKRQQILRRELEFYKRIFMSWAIVSLVVGGYIIGENGSFLPGYSEPEAGQVLDVAVRKFFPVGRPLTVVRQELELLWQAKRCASSAAAYRELYIEGRGTIIEALWDYCRQAAYGREVRLELAFDGIDALSHIKIDEHQSIL
jgi:hypothetical protein